MPELPEVEFAVRLLRRSVRGCRIVAVLVHHRSQRRTLTPSVARRLRGRRIVEISRRGKHQLIHLDDGATLLVHFRLDGDWVRSKAGGALPPHARVTLELDDGHQISLTDPRALCTATWHASGDPLLSALGPEPEDVSFTPEAFRQRLARKRGPIKPVLIDQRVIAGVGNIYAAEACWHARIHPAARANSLSAARVERLLRALRRALADGHANAGRHHRGERQIPFAVYDRAARPCPRCGTAIRRIVQSGRGTWYCPLCQRS